MVFAYSTSSNHSPDTMNATSGNQHSESNAAADKRHIIPAAQQLHRMIVFLIYTSPSLAINSLS